MSKDAFGRISSRQIETCLLVIEKEESQDLKDSSNFYIALITVKDCPRCCHFR